MSMRLGAVTTLKDVSFGVDTGEIIALLGDSRAGKSAFRIISAGMIPTSGHFVSRGRAVRVLDSQELQSLGIEPGYQDLSICRNADAAANDFLRVANWSVASPAFRYRESARWKTSPEGMAADCTRWSPYGSQQSIALMVDCKQLGGIAKLAAANEFFAALGTERVLPLMQ